MSNKHKAYKRNLEKKPNMMFTECQCYNNIVPMSKAMRDLENYKMWNAKIRVNDMRSNYSPHIKSTTCER